MPVARGPRITKDTTLGELQRLIEAGDVYFEVASYRSSRTLLFNVRWFTGFSNEVRPQPRGFMHEDLALALDAVLRTEIDAGSAVGLRLLAEFGDGSPPTVVSLPQQPRNT